MMPLIADLLKLYPDWYRPSGSIVELGSGGGRSGSRLWRWTSHGGEVLLRAWPIGMSPARASSIHGWLARTRDHVIARPFASLGGATFHVVDGRVWQLEPWLSGQAIDVDQWDEGLVRVAFSGLRRIHDELGTSRTEGRSAAIGRRLAEVTTLGNEGFGRFREAVGDSSTTDARIAREWIAQAERGQLQMKRTLATVAEFEVPLQPCVRDCRIEHFYFENGRLTGLVDYGAMDVDTPWIDVARLFVDLREPALRHAALSAHGVDDEGIRLLEPLRQSAAFLIGAHWIRWHFVERREFDSADVTRGLRYGLDCLLSPRG